MKNDTETEKNIDTQISNVISMADAEVKNLENLEKEEKCNAQHIISKYVSKKFRFERILGANFIIENGPNGKRIPFDDECVYKITHEYNLKTQKPVQSKLFKEVLRGYLFSSHNYNFTDLIEKHAPQWDGTQRIMPFFKDLINSKEWNAKDILKTRAFYIDLWNRVSKPGSFARCLIIKSSGKGGGKSLFTQFLSGAITEHPVPELAGTNLYTNSVKVNGDLKAVGELLQGKIICELAELSALAKADSDDVKDFLTRTSDDFRKAYAESVSHIPRSAFIMGNTNNEVFLREEDRRYIIFEMNRQENNGTSYKKQIFEMVPFFWQFWAEIKHKAISNPLTEEEQSFLNKIVSEESKKNVNDSAEQELIDILGKPFFEKDFITFAMAKEFIVRKIPSQKINNKSLGNVLRIMGYEDKQESSGLRRRGWFKIVETQKEVLKQPGLSDSWDSLSAKEKAKQINDADKKMRNEDIANGIIV